MRELFEARVGRVLFPSALVIESSPGQARLVGDLVRGLGFDHVWAGLDSATAFADLHQLTPDLLILAVDAEPLDGFALAHTIRTAAQPPLNDLPILFLTNKATEPQVRQVREIQRAALLVKPPTQETLRSHIAPLLRGKSGPPASEGG